MRRLLALLVALVALAVPAGAAHAQLHIGIGDQKPEFFSDPRYEALGVRYARFSAGWDAMSSSWQRDELDAWLKAARAAGVEPLITFGHSRGAGRRRVLPTPAQYVAQFRAFRARYPWVVDFAVWNEANHCGEPVCHRVELVAAYYKALRKACPRCRILAAELLDFPNMVSWVRQFRRAAGADPAYWGLHNYRDANRLQTDNTRALLGVTSGEVWLTETGGIVGRRNKSSVFFEESPRHAATATRWLFDDIAGLSPRLTRVYLYHWSASTANDTWDSALIGPDGAARPALAVVQRELEDQRPPPGDPEPAPAPPAPAPAGTVPNS